MKICIVTSHLEGVSRRHEVGSHCLELARFLARENHEVAILHTGALPPGGARAMATLAAKWPFAIEVLEPEMARRSVHPRHLKRSWLIYAWLKDRHFDLLQFQDDSADAFVCVEAKVTGEDFRDTTLSLYLHGPDEWKPEIGRSRLESDRLFIDYAIRYAAEHADQVLAPMESFFDIAARPAWKLPKRRLVLPYLPTDAAEAKPDAPGARQLLYLARPGEASHMIQFLRALSLLHEAGFPRLKEVRVILFTMEDDAERANLVAFARHYFRQHLPGVACELKGWSEIQPLLDRLPRERSLLFFSAFHALAPARVLEAVARGRCLALAETEDFRGLPVADGGRVAWTPRDLAARIGDFLEGKISPRAGDPPSTAGARWANYLEQIGIPVHAPMRANLGESSPRVTICVAHYNQGNYLPATLKSLAAQTYGNFQVIVVDDASTDEKSRAVFWAEEKKYAARGWKFIGAAENGGPARARNEAARHAADGLLLFFDSDDLACPDLVERMVRALDRPGVDYVGSSSFLFEDRNGPPKLTGIGTYAGGSIECGFFHPPSGMVFALRRDLYFELGGLTEERVQECDEDWHFHIKALAVGYRLQVLPRPCYFYRMQPESRSHVMAQDLVNNLEPLLGQAPAWQINLVRFAQMAARKMDDLARTRRELEEIKRMPAVRVARFLARARKDLGRLLRGRRKKSEDSPVPENLAPDPSFHID